MKTSVSNLSIVSLLPGGPPVSNESSATRAEVARRQPVLPRRLYLDDSRNCPVGWIPVRDADDFKHLVEHYEWDDISFDWHLGHGSEFRPNEVFTGETLLIWMIHRGLWPKNKPTVHSDSLNMKLRMQALIEQHWPGDTDA